MPRRRTWELPRVDGVDVDDGDDALDVVAEAVELVAEVEAYQLLLRRVEAVPRREAGGGHAAGRSARARTSRPAASSLASHLCRRSGRSCRWRGGSERLCCRERRMHMLSKSRVWWYILVVRCGSACGE